MVLFFGPLLRPLAVAHPGYGSGNTWRSCRPWLASLWILEDHVSKNRKVHVARMAQKGYRTLVSFPPPVPSARKSQLKKSPLSNPTVDPFPSTTALPFCTPHSKGKTQTLTPPPPGSAPSSMKTSTSNCYTTYSDLGSSDFSLTPKYPIPNFAIDLGTPTDKLFRASGSPFTNPEQRRS